MKKIIAAIVMTVWGGCFVAQAQTKEVDRTIKEDTIWVDYKTRYTSSFWDNFYVEADFAGRMLMGAEDTHLSFGSRLKPGFGRICLSAAG